MSKEVNQRDTIYSLDDVDTKPVPEKGMEGFYKKWSSVVRYPADARRNGAEGKVFLSFIIDGTGKIINPKVERGLGYGLGEAAIDGLLKANVKWTPATKDGMNVKVKIFLPFAFRLG